MRLEYPIPSDPGEIAENASMAAHPVVYEGAVSAWCPAIDATKDLIGGNDGTLNGGLTIAQSSRGTTYRNDGTGYLSAPTTGMSTVVGSFAAWVKLESLSVDFGAFNFYTSNSDRLLLWFHASLGAPDQWRFRMSGSAILDSPTTITTTGVWQHLAVTWDFTNDNYAFYLDGKLDVSSTSSYSSASMPSTVEIGSYTYSASRNELVGDIGVPEFYNRAISSAEVRQLYEATRNQFPEGFRRRSMPIPISTGAAPAGNRRRRFLIGAAG